MATFFFDINNSEEMVLLRKTIKTKLRWKIAR